MPGLEFQTSLNYSRDARNKLNLSGWVCGERIPMWLGDWRVATLPMPVASPDEKRGAQPKKLVKSLKVINSTIAGCKSGWKKRSNHRSSSWPKMSKKHFGKGHPPFCLPSCVVKWVMLAKCRWVYGSLPSLVVPVCRWLDHHTVSSFSSARAFCKADPLTDPKRGSFLISELLKLSSYAWFRVPD